MNTFLNITRGIVCAAILSGCAANVPLQRTQTESLAKNASIADVEKVAGKSTPIASHHFTSQGKTFDARHYNLQTGSKQQMQMVCAPTCFPIFITMPVTDAYVMVFETPKQQLFAWGTLEELSRSPDDSISAIMPDLKKSYDVVRQAKK